MSSNFISRLAPTPSGYLHFGNAFNFLLTYLLVNFHDGVLHLRIDDLDGPRVERTSVEDIFIQLEWLGIDYHFGLSAANQRRCAEVYEAPDGPFMDVIGDPQTLLGKCWIPLPLTDYEENFNSTLYGATEMPSFNGHGTARDVACLFGTLARGGEIDSVRLISQTLREDAITEGWDQTDALGMPCRMSRGGFMLRNDALAPYNRNPRSFGHSDLGVVPLPMAILMTNSALVPAATRRPLAQSPSPIPSACWKRRSRTYNKPEEPAAARGNPRFHDARVSDNPLAGPSLTIQLRQSE